MTTPGIWQSSKNTIFVKSHQNSYYPSNNDHNTNTYSNTNNSHTISKYEAAKLLFALDSDNYTLEQIKNRRNMLIKASHPDGKDGDMEYAQKVNEAYQVLKEHLS